MSVVEFGVGRPAGVVDMCFVPVGEEGAEGVEEVGKGE